MDSIIKHEVKLPYFPDEIFRKAQKSLTEHMKNKDFFRENQFHVYNEVNIPNNFAGKNLKRTYYQKCKFIGVDLTNTGFAGSIIHSSEFRESILSNTQLDSCELDGCTFQQFSFDNFKNVNFSKSIISNSSFINCEMDAINFTDTTFHNVEFKNCSWISHSLENAVFNNTLFDSVSLSKLNFEFSQFNNVSMNNVRLPFPTIPYIFNGLSYLMHTSDNVCISSAQASTGKISAKEYLTHLKDLEIFYIRTQNFFPLANIYIAQQQWDNAYSAILQGIGHSIKILRSFRLVNYYCKLLQLTPVFSNTTLSDTYRYIMKTIDMTDWRAQDRYNYSLYINTIRTTLMNERTSDSLQFSISTNISNAEHSKLATLLAAIDNAAEFIKDGFDLELEYYVEVRHNSPYELFINFFGSTEALFGTLGILYGAFFGIGQLKNQYWESKIKKQNYEFHEKMNPLKFREKENVIQEKEIDIELKRLTLKERSQEKGAEIHQRLQAQNIVLSGGYTLFNGKNEFDETSEETSHFYFE